VALTVALALTFDEDLVIILRAAENSPAPFSAAGGGAGAVVVFVEAVVGAEVEVQVEGSIEEDGCKWSELRRDCAGDSSGDVGDAAACNWRSD
jgi:hypothetical protein